LVFNVWLVRDLFGIISQQIDASSSHLFSFQDVLFAIVYVLWKERNMHIFQHKEETIHSIVKRVKLQYFGGLNRSLSHSIFTTIFGGKIFWCALLLEFKIYSFSFVGPRFFSLFELLFFGSTSCAHASLTLFCGSIFYFNLLKKIEYYILLRVKLDYGKFVQVQIKSLLALLRAPHEIEPFFNFFFSNFF